MSEDADSFSQAVSRARWTVSCWHGGAGTCRNGGRFSVSDCWKAGQRGEGWEVTLVGVWGIGRGASVLLDLCGCSFLLSQTEFGSVHSFSLFERMQPQHPPPLPTILLCPTAPKNKHERERLQQMLTSPLCTDRSV